MLLAGGAVKVEGRNGYYVKWVLMAGSLDNVVAREKIFGPVAYLTPFEDERNAIEETLFDYWRSQSVVRSLAGA